MKKNIIIMAAVFLAISCKQSNTKDTAIQKNIKQKEDSKSELIEGKLTIGFEVASFKPCNEPLDYWIEDTTGRMDTLYKKIVGKNDLAKYNPVYCKLRAHKLPKNNAEFAEDYDGFIAVDQIIEMTTITPEKKCK